MPSIQEMIQAKIALRATELKEATPVLISIKDPKELKGLSSTRLADKIEAIKHTHASSAYAEAVMRSMNATKPLGPLMPLVPASTPVKLSLAQKLRLKKEAAEQETLEVEPEEVLPHSLADEPIDQALMTRVYEEPKAVQSLPEALEVSRLLSLNKSIVQAIKIPLVVIQTEQGFMSLEELKAEITRLEKLLAKIKSQAIQKKVNYLQEKLVELEAQIDLEQEAMAPEAGEVVSKEAVKATQPLGEIEAPFQPFKPISSDTKETFSLSVVLNERQLMAKEMALSGKSFCLIGPAGTGKTTAQRSVAEALLDSEILSTCSFKRQGQKERVSGPSFVAVAFTRRASSNLARAIHKDPKLEKAFRYNIMTVHALLEFEPVIFFDHEKNRQSMRFEPKRDANTPLTLTHLVIEESSMLGLDLSAQLFDALPTGVQIIYIGDINQLPPVFGASILNYALVQLPVIELTEVYRNGGIILENAHRILKGESLIEGSSIDQDTGKESKFIIVRGKSDVQVGQERMSHSLGLLFKHWESENDYRPDEDMILSPFNRQPLGTDNMNKWIAQFLGEKRKAIVFEILAGFNTHYLAIGDRVMVNKQDGYITNIARNGDYLGKDPQLQGSDLSRFGMRIMGADTASDLDELCDATLNYTDFNLDSIQDQEGERKQQASHVVEAVLESGETVELKSAGDFGPASFSLGYVLTVHKAQGCEFRKVFIIFHKDHSVMLFRELFYTAETRAREEVCLIAKDWVIEKALKTQRIKGNTLKDKIEYFNSGAVDMLGNVRCTK